MIIATCACKNKIFEGDSSCSACGNADPYSWKYLIEEKSASEIEKMQYAKASYYLGKTMGLYERAEAKEEVTYLRAFVKRFIYV